MELQIELSIFIMISVLIYHILNRNRYDVYIRYDGNTYIMSKIRLYTLISTNSIGDAPEYGTKAMLPIILPCAYYNVDEDKPTLRQSTFKERIRIT